MRLVVGISGATGVIYGIRLLQVLSELKDIETHLIISESGELCIKYETDWKIKDVKALANFSYGINSIEASIGSGSFKKDGMVVIPCSMKTLSALANSYDENLMIRCGDVTLKQRSTLVLVVRETPLHLGHLRNMTKAAEIGAVILPPIPAFYGKPKRIEDLIDHTVGRVLDMFKIDHNLYQEWQGLK